MSLAGIDEAGRGPVIGPMIIAGVKVSDEKKLVNLGLKDSKLLSRNQRERLFEVVRQAADDYKILLISAQEIDECLASDSSNLNWLEADFTIKILRELKPKKAIVDCPSNNVKKYAEYLEKGLDFGIKLMVEHKADFNYPVVSAASILAKVTRDREIDSIKKEIGFDFGSGYPSDPLTQRFLREHHTDFPRIFRKSWASYKTVLEGNRQRKLGEFYSKSR